MAHLLVEEFGHVVRRVMLAVVLTAGLLVMGSRVAFACTGDETEVEAGTGGTICIPAVDPGTPGGPGAGDGGGGSADPVDMKCGYAVVDPQPPKGHPIWGGHTPDDGAIYWKICPGHLGTYPSVFLPNGEDPEPPDPAVLARRAMGELRLTSPAIRLAPSPPAKTYVGLETWLWIPARQWAPLTKSVTAGATTVTVTAAPQSVAWRLGGGGTTCRGPGRAWVAGRMSEEASTDCDFVFDRVSSGEPGGRFRVSATITFRADWTCSGSCLAGEGTLGDVVGPTAQTAIRVSERQSVNVSPEGS